MKFPMTMALTASVAAGFTAVYSGLGMMSAWKEESKPSPDIMTEDFTFGAASSKSKSSGKSSPGALQGPALAGQIRKALTLSGIDPSWAEGLAAADTSGFPDLLEKMKTLSDAHRERLREILMGRWAMLDPGGGAEFFKAKKDDANLSALLRQWVRIDFPTAAGKAGEYGDQFLRRTLREKAQLDPAGLLAWLANRPDLNPLTVFNSGANENTAALKRLAEADPDKMLTWIRQVPEEKLDGDFISNFAAQLAKRSPDEGTAWAKSLKNPSRSALAMTGVAKMLAVSDPERALTLMAELPATDGYESRKGQYEIIDRLDLTDPDKALSLADLLPKGSEMRSQLTRNLLQGLLVRDPAKAFALSETLGVETGSADWSSVPPEAETPEAARRILETARRVENSTYREAVVKESLLAWMQKDPVSLASYLKENLGTPLLASMRENLQTGLAMQKMLTGTADETLVDLLGLPPAVLVKAQADYEPAQAAAAFESVEDPADRLKLAGDIAWRMDRKDAMAWAETLTNPDEQASAWKSVAKAWVRSDSLRTSEWIATLQPGKGRDSAVLAMTEGIRETDPDLAWKWALSMTEPALRQEALSAAALEWGPKDSPALGQALDNGNITPAERQSVLDYLKSIRVK